jgi:hypothetical protein
MTIMDFMHIDQAQLSISATNMRGAKRTAVNLEASGSHSGVLRITPLRDCQVIANTAELALLSAGRINKNGQFLGWSG